MQNAVILRETPYRTSSTFFVPDAKLISRLARSSQLVEYEKPFTPTLSNLQSTLVATLSSKQAVIFRGGEMVSEAGYDFR